MVGSEGKPPKEPLAVCPSEVQSEKWVSVSVQVLGREPKLAVLARKELLEEQ